MCLHLLVVLLLHRLKERGVLVLVHERSHDDVAGRQEQARDATNGCRSSARCTASEMEETGRTLERLTCASVECSGKRAASYRVDVVFSTTANLQDSVACSSIHKGYTKGQCAQRNAPLSV